MLLWLVSTNKLKFFGQLLMACNFQVSRMGSRIWQPRNWFDQLPILRIAISLLMRGYEFSEKVRQGKAGQ